MTPWLIRAIAGRSPVFVNAGDPKDHYLVSGSVVGYSGPSSTIWGAGIMYRNDELCPDATFAAVRGPLTRARAHACGAHCPEIFGDPALLLPKLYQPASASRSGIGFALHFSDVARFGDVLRRLGNVKLIDLQAPVERVVDELTSCELVASTSLHGLVAAQAYGIPAAWVRLAFPPSGDDSKFHDHFLATGQRVEGPVWLDLHKLDLTPVRAAASTASFPNLPALWSACPFRYEDDPF